MNNFKIDLRPTSTPEFMKQNFRTLISLLIGEKDRLHLLHTSEPFTGDWMPIDMHREGVVLDAIHRCYQEALKPTRENVIGIIQAQGTLDKPREFVDALLKEQTDNRVGVESISAFAEMWMHEERGKMASDEIVKIMNRPTADYAKKHEEASRVWALAAPNMNDVARYNQQQWIRDFLARQTERAEIAKSGIKNGPTLPYKGHEAFFTNLKWGELTSIIADTGYGKTMISQDIAEHLAWHEHLNADVHWIELETPVDVMQMRTVAKHCLIPFDALASGRIDPTEDKWKQRIARFNANISAKETDGGGKLFYHYVPSRKLHAVTSIMRREAMLSFAKKDCSVIFIIDYLQKFDWNSVIRYDQTRALEVIGEEISGVTRSLRLRGKVHTFLFAQENTEKGEAFGTSVLRKISQVMFSVKRMAPSGKDEAVKDSKGMPSKDAMGFTRYWSRESDEFGHKGFLQIIKGNDLPVVEERKIKIWFEGAYYRIAQDPDQIKRMKAKGHIR